jgi:hypothetical protein
MIQGVSGHAVLMWIIFWFLYLRLRHQCRINEEDIEIQQFYIQFCLNRKAFGEFEIEAVEYLRQKRGVDRANVIVLRFLERNKKAYRR